MTKKRKEVLKPLIEAYKQMGQICGIEALEELAERWENTDREEVRICYEAVVIAIWELS